jgi:hypothetical protein
MPCRCVVTTHDVGMPMCMSSPHDDSISMCRRSNSHDDGPLMACRRVSRATKMMQRADVPVKSMRTWHDDSARRCSCQNHKIIYTPMCVLKTHDCMSMWPGLNHKMNNGTPMCLSKTHDGMSIACRPGLRITRPHTMMACTMCLSGSHDDDSMPMRLRTESVASVNPTL